MTSSQTEHDARVVLEPDLQAPASASLVGFSPAGQGVGIRCLPAGLPNLHMLVVDDDVALRKACVEIAAGMGLLTSSAGSVSEALKEMEQQHIDMLLLDLRLPGGGGLKLMEEVRSRYPSTAIVVMTAFATVASAVEALRKGADNYLTKPFTLDGLTDVIVESSRRLNFDLESRRLRERLRTAHGMGDLIGTSPGMEKVYRILSKVAVSSHPVLILGESGTGKEMVAHAIHTAGPYSSAPFVPVDCSSLTPTLIESELFGHIKGAFTGANRNRDGLLVSANGGTVFLDEIGELPPDMQSKLLRVLQEKEVRPVGSSRTVPFTARVLAATNRDLNSMVAQGQFRKDLYFRLNVVNLRIPPLRERREDIPLLAQFFLEQVERQSGKLFRFSDDSLQLLIEYDWPGNVRELEHTVERTCALSSGPIVHSVDLPTQLKEFQAHRQESAAQATIPTNHVEAGPTIVSIAEMERQAILGTIRQLKGDKLMAAKLLGIGKTTLYRKLKEYGLGDGGDLESDKVG